MSEKKSPTSLDERGGEAGSREPFFKRWARLKADNAPEEKQRAAPVPAEEPAAEESAETGREAGEADALPPGDEDMPPLESLGEDSDYSSFLSPRVSAELRKQALRKLFRSPKFNVISELDDYIDDFRNFPALGDLVTSDMKHAAAVLLKKQLEAEEAAAAKAAKADEPGAAPGADSPARESLDSVRPEDGAARTAGAADSQDETQDPSEDPERDA